MRSILPIWKTWTLGTGPGFMDMKTGFVPQHAYTMWEAAPAAPGIIFLKSDILPGTMCT